MSVSAEGWEQLGRGTEGRDEASAAGSIQLRTGPGQPGRAGDTAVSVPTAALHYGL